VSEETVKTVLQSDLVSLDSETRLLSALIDWGRAQVLREEGIAPDDDQLRAKIDTCLKLVRFGAMTIEEFSEVSDMCNVLTSEEKLKIMRSIVLVSKEEMPENFSSNFTSRKMCYYVPIKCTELYQDYHLSKHGRSNVLTFSVSKPVYLLGVHVLDKDGARFEVSCKGIITKAVSDASAEIEYEGKEIIALWSSLGRFLVKENVLCSIAFQNRVGSRNCYFTIDNLTPSPLQRNNKQPVVNILETKCEFQVCGLLLQDA
jgi:hypothetical protein